MLPLPMVPTVREYSAKIHPGERVATMDNNALRGLNILLINMPLRESAKPNTPPQGPALLAARARLYGAKVSILDLNAYRIHDENSHGKVNGRWKSYSEVEALLARHTGVHGEPDVIALSGMITTLRWQRFVADTVRRLFPRSFIISGGGLATEIREGLFSWIPVLDAVSHSEGDDVFLSLSEDVNQAKKHRRLGMTHLPQCLGTWQGRPRFLYEGNRVQDLDSLPLAAWDLLHQDVDGNPILEWYIRVPVWGGAANNSSATIFEMVRSLTAVSSRGCPYECAFCYRGAQGERLYRMRSAQNLVDEVLAIIKLYNIDFFGFNDDNFAVDIRRIRELPEAFKLLDGFRWGTHTRLDEAADERAELMARAGCIYIGFGAESASPPVLEQMKKGGFILRPKGELTNQVIRVGDFEFPTTMVRGIQNCLKVGIHPNCTWIMGFPTETLQDLKTSVAFMHWQKDLMTQGLVPGTAAYERAIASVNQKMFVATAYPGTAMFREPRVKELLTEHFDMAFDEKGEPIPNDALLNYTLELDDATKVLEGTDGRLLNFGAMSEKEFLQAREYVDSNQTERILDM